MMLKNMAPRLAERGKIKIGAKGAVRKSRDGAEFQPPQKLDHFVVTTLERGADNNFVRDEEIHAMIGDKPKRIPVRLLFNDIEMNFMSRLACFVGRTMWCAGDRETAQRLNKDGLRETVQCPCPRIEQGYAGKDKCKVNGALSVIIDGVPGVGNVWTFRTTSWNSVQNLTSAMYQIKALSGGVLAGLPIDLVLAPKEVTTPDGKMMKAWIVSMQFSGTVEDLRSVGYKLLEAEATHGLRIRQVEDDVRRRLALPAPSDVPLPGDDVDDVVDEFYPDQHTRSAAPPRPTRGQFKALPAGKGTGEDNEAGSADAAAQADQSPAAHADAADGEDGAPVYDAFGDVVSRHPTLEDARKAFREMLASEPPQTRASLQEYNHHLIDPGSAPPDPARAAAVDPANGDGFDTKGNDDPSPGTTGSGGRAPSAWESGSPAKIDGRNNIPLTNPATGETRFFVAVPEWCEGMKYLIDTGDWHAVWSANLETHAKLVQATKNHEMQGYLKAVADHAVAAQQAEQQKGLS